MPSAFVVDLIDHKQRVAKHMQTLTTLLIERIIQYGDIAEGPGCEEEATLLDLFEVACKLRRAGHCSFTLTGQIEQIVIRTADVYLAGSSATGVERWREFAAIDLFERAAVHDNSKFSEEEFSLYEQAFPELQKYAYGSPEFNAALATIEPAINHHYAVNDHHPQYFVNGIPDMHLIQLKEMTCDWVAASERSQKDIYAGMEINQRRFNIEPQLLPIIVNTIKILKNDR